MAHKYVFRTDGFLIIYEDGEKCHLLSSMGGEKRPTASAHEAMWFMVDTNITCMDRI